MKIMHVAGSPRKTGNSMTLANRFIDKAEDRGGDVKTYFLNQMNYRGCQGCYQCKTETEKCVLKDDLTEVLDNLWDTDLLLISTPVYFGDLSAQLKGFIDRLFSFAKSDYLTNPNPIRLPKGKKLVFIQIQNADKESHKDIYEKYLYYFEFMGFVEPQLVHAYGIIQPDEIESLSEFTDQVDSAVEKIFT